jgi:hypothetical protein
MQVSVLLLFFNQLLFATFGVLFYTMAIKGVTHADERPEFLGLYALASSGFLSQIVVISFLWTQSSPDHSRVPVLAIIGMTVVWAFGVACGIVSFVDSSQYFLILRVVTAGIAAGSLVCWLLIAYSVQTLLRVLANLRIAQREEAKLEDPLARKSKVLGSSEGTTSSSSLRMFNKKKTLASAESILSRMTFRARVTAALLIFMGLPSIAIMVCLVVPVELVQQYSHFFFNGVLAAAMMLSIRINLLYGRTPSDSILDSLIKTKRAFSKDTALSLTSSDSSASSSLLLRNQREESQTIDRPFASNIGSV